jgi:membrane-associated protease RseP (regulator of RpoE activity)
VRYFFKNVEKNMNLWFLLLLGLITYLMVQRSVGQITRTPVWVLWFVLMTPAFVLTGWTAVNRATSAPQGLMLFLFLACPLLYWLLFQWGRRIPGETQTAPTTSEPQSAAINPTSEPPPAVRPIEPTEETQLRNCFPWSTYYIQNIEYRPQAIICRGQLRTKPTEAYKQIKANIEEHFGDRFLLIFQEGVNGKPIFVLVPNTQTAKGAINERLTKPLLALALVAATFITTAIAGLEIADVKPVEWRANSALLIQGLPYAFGIMTILGFHEMGHYLVARYYKIRATLPYFIPMPSFFFLLGTLGAFIQMKSPVPNRKALFDVSIAGPLAGFIVTLPLLIWGLANSQIVDLPKESKLLDLDALNPRYSILLAFISKLALGSNLTPEHAINMHPIAVAGFLGLIVTALNLMPVGQLDGGHIVHAMFGQRNAVVIGQVSRLLLFALSFLQQDFLLWAVILLFMPLFDEPALNDVTELDNKRDMAGLFVMALLVIIILPVPQVLANLLQI